jgi:acid phosphatase (class A)
MSSTRALLVLACQANLVGCALVRPGAPAPVPEIRPGILAGYLPQTALPNALALLPPPPAAGSPGAALDEDVYARTRALVGTPRWALATADANLMFPAAAETFACALDARIDEAETPRLYVLMRRSLADAGLATYSAKNHYQRTRPFVVHDASTCTPKDEQMLRGDGSYPSGHAAIGWAWGLILAEVAPERGNALLERALAFGESRVVCGVHWLSDVIEGRDVGAAAVARLHADPAFAADLAAAKTEFAALRAKAAGPGRDCAAEGAALAAQFGQ